MDQRQGVKRKIQEATVEVEISTKKSKIDKNQEVRKVRLRDEPMNLVCRWGTCDFSSSTWETFEAHSSSHVDNDTNHSACRWVNCEYTSSGLLLKQHLSYHGYISRLCNIGQNTAERRGLPECRQPEKLEIPVNEGGYTCHWQRCHANFITIYDFLNHLVIHVKEAAIYDDEKLQCCWQNCDNLAGFSSRTKLSEHLRKHSQEKEVACPTCFRTFSNKTKFSDHRTRQGSDSISSCPFCAETFQSERLMRDHSRSHSRLLPCNICGSFFSRSSHLMLHYRAKHMDSKFYNCTQCDKKFVTKSNLKAHLKTHEKENSKECHLCEYRCRSSVGLNSHLRKEHNTRDGRYGCHLCDEEFVRSASLTKHLKEVHTVALPVGYNRFSYQKKSDGVHRLKFGDRSGTNSMTVAPVVVKQPQALRSDPMTARDFYQTFLAGSPELDEQDAAMGTKKQILDDNLAQEGAVASVNFAFVAEEPSVFPKFEEALPAAGSGYRDELFLEDSDIFYLDGNDEQKATSDYVDATSIPESTAWYTEALNFEYFE